MTARTIVEGVRKCVATDLTSSAQTAVLSANTNINYAVLGISIANTDASNSCTARVEWNNGTTDFVLVEEENLAAKARVEYDFPLFLNGGGSVKVTAQNADDLHVIVSYVETPGRVG